MKIYTYILLAIILISVGSTSTLYSNNNVFFENFGISDKLYNSTVISIVQDKNDLMWFATFDGLNKFDGYSLTVYRTDENDKNSLLSNFTRSLYIDNDGILWIGTNQGLSKYIYDMDWFENYTNDENKDDFKINAIIDYSKDNHLLLGTDKGLFKFNKTNNTFSKMLFANDEPYEILSLAYIDEHIIIGASSGLYVYKDSEDKQVLSYKLDNVRVQTVIEDKVNNLWVGTEGAGLFLINYKSGEILENYINNPNDTTSICSNYIRTLLIDDNRRMWIGTFHGLSIYDRTQDSFTNYFSDPFDSSSLSHNSIRSIVQDSQGGIWLGTYYGGINYYHSLKNQFYHIKQSSRNNSLSDRVISPILEDSGTREIWIGTNDNGINIYNPDKGSFHHLNKDSKKSISSNNIKSLLFSLDNKYLYAGSHGGGLMKIDKVTYEVSVLLPSQDIYSLIYDQNNNIWIGTLSGLFKYNESNNEIVMMDNLSLTSKQVSSLAVDKNNRLWIGGDKSLARLDLNNNKIVEFTNTFENVKINCVIEDSDNNIWIGTNSGFYQYVNDQEFKKYSEKDGLTNKVVFGIIEDSLGYLWISTHYGISKFDPISKSFRNYGMTDGLPFQQFNNYSFCKTASGRLYFGGINGIVSFIPERLKNNPFSPQPIISELNVQNEIIKPSLGGILRENIISSDAIILPSNKASFSLRFSVPNYLSGMHNTFKYKLEGYDKEWTISSENLYASYSNLNPGKYTFVLLSANNEGMWSEKSKEILIVVKPMWYQSTWLKLLIIITILTILYFYWNAFIQKQEIKRQLIKERYEKEKNEEINQAKVSFFVNVSHELRSPLTLIISPLQDLLERVSDGWEKNQLDIIKQNADKLLRLTNQLIDYRRAELGVFELNIKRVNPLQVVLSVMSQFKTMASRMELEYGFENYINDSDYIIDENYLDVILSNLLSNAFKFTPEKGRITVSLIEDFEYLILEVSDTGCGISDYEQNKIFNRFYKVNAESKNNDIGIGIGLSITKRLIEKHHGKIEIVSEVNKGTTFKAYFPQNENLYDSNELRSMYLPSIKSSTENYEQEDSSKPDVILTHNILIVEDDLDLLQYLYVSLSDSFKIITASDGSKALEVLYQNQIDIVITDVMMDGMGGVELCQAIKEDVQICHIPVIMLTAKSTVDDQLAGLKAGADDYVTKPFTISLLKAKIKNMMSSRERVLNYYSSVSDVEPEKITNNQIDNDFLHKAKSIVLDHLDNASFTTEILCEEMGMSRTSLHTKLKALTGESTIDFIRKIRFNEAEKLLSTGKFNVSEVSYMVGFNSLSYFSTSFKKYFGYLPSEHLKNN